MTRPLRKEAAGELTARFARWLSTPIKGTPKLLQKVRTKPELDALEQTWRSSAQRYVEDPIRKGLTRVGMDRAVAAGLRGAAPALAKTPVIGRKIPLPAERAQWAADAGKGAVNFVAAKPHLALAPPGMGLPIMAFDSMKTKLLNATPGLKVPLPAQRPAQIASGVLPQAAEIIKLAQVMPYQQSTDWTCSAACLRAVLGHYDVNVPEELAVQAIGTRQGRGAECNEIMWGAHKLGFEAFEFSFDSLEQAKFLTDQDIPIIADIQSFNHPGKGHYVVITDISDDLHSGRRSVWLMDPNTSGNQRMLSEEEMDERWWDRAMAPPHDMMPKWGIIVLPPEMS